MATGFEEAKAYLKAGQSGQPSLYDHLSDVVLRLIREKPDYALDNIERISALVKHERMDVETLSEGQNVDPSADEKANIVNAINKISALFPSANEEETPEIGHIPDILNDSNMFEWAGIGLGAEETFQLTLAFQKLAGAHPISSLRFFGRVYGTKSNYYIAEAKLNEYPAAPERKIISPCDYRNLFSDGCGILLQILNKTGLKIPEPVAMNLFTSQQAHVR